MNALSKQVGNRGRCLAPELAHRYFYFCFFRKRLRFRIPSVHVPHYSQPWIVRQHPFDARRHLFGTVRDDYLSGVLRVTNPHPAAVVY